MKTLIFLIGFGLVSVAHCSGQRLNKSEDRSSPQRQMYMMRSYGLSYDQAKLYDDAVADKSRQEENIRHKVLAVDVYDRKMKDEYSGFCQNVSSIMDEAQYDRWWKATHANERYRFLTEERGASKEQADLVYEAQKEFQEGKRALNQDVSSPDLKADRLKILIDTYATTLTSILGEKLAQEYITREDLNYAALSYVRKVGVTYYAAHKIAIVQNDCKMKEEALRARGMRKTDMNEALAENEEAKKRHLKAVLSVEDYAKWEKFYDNSLLISMKSDYGLTKSQIDQFAALYNEYAITKYKIGQSKASKSEKASLIQQAHEQFCADAKAILPEQAYDRWMVKKMYNAKKNE